MKDKFDVQFTKIKTDNIPTLSELFGRLKIYLKKVFWYARAQIRRRRRSYRSMFMVSIVLLAFVFTNLILNEARIMGDISSACGGTHHVMFLGIDGTQAKGAVAYREVTDSLIIPVIATMESSVDSSTVGKVAVLTEEVKKFMQVGITHGRLPEDGEIIVPRNLYSQHDFLILGELQDMYFDGAEFVYRPMTMGGIYNCTDQDSPYIFVNEATGEAIKEATGNKVSFDTYLILNYASDRNSAKAADYIIKKYDIHDTAEQQVQKDQSTVRGRYREYINYGSSNARFLSADVNSMLSYPALVIAALIMASFMTNYTERHISEYGVLASYGAKRRHLYGVVMGQVLYVTLLSILPVLLISMVVASIYTDQYNAARLAGNLPVVMSIPMSRLVKHAILYILILFAICTVTMRRMLSQFPYPMVRGNTATKIPFVKNSSKRLAKAKDKVRSIAMLQAKRQIKRNVIPAFATSLICIVCACFVGYNLLMYVLYLQGEAEKYEDKEFTGQISSTSDAEYADGWWRGYIRAETVDTLTALSGVEMAGGLRGGVRWLDDERAYFSSSELEIYVDEAHIGYTKGTAHQFFPTNAPGYSNSAHEGGYARFNPLYVDPEILNVLYSEVLEGDVNRIYTEPNSLILVDNQWADDASHYHVGDTLKVRSEKSGQLEVTIVAVVTGDYLKDMGWSINNGHVIMSPETGETIDGFPATLRNSILFRFEGGMTNEEYQALADEISDDVNIIRYDVTFYETERLKVSKMTALENNMTAVFIIMLYIALCVLDYYHSSESILSKRKEFCTLRQLGAKEKDIYKTTRAEVYGGQVLGLIFTGIIALLVIIAILAYGANLANMYRMTIPEGPILDEMLEIVRQMQITYFFFTFAVVVLSLPFHLLAFVTAIAGTILPTRAIMKENIAATLKGSAEI